MAGRGQGADAHGTNFHFVAIAERGVREGGFGFGSYIYGCAGAGGKFFVPGDEVRVQVRFEDVADFEILLFGGLEINIDVALRVDDRCLALGADHVGGVRQTGQVELLKVHWELPPCE